MNTDEIKLDLSDDEADQLLRAACADNEDVWMEQFGKILLKTGDIQAQLLARASVRCNPLVQGGRIPMPGHHPEATAERIVHGYHWGVVPYVATPPSERLDHRRRILPD